MVLISLLLAVQQYFFFSYGEVNWHIKEKNCSVKHWIYDAAGWEWECW